MLHQNIDEAFRDATAIGIPVFVSSGDQGSGSMRGQVDQNEVTLLSKTAHAGYPASSPYATAVGGTMLYAQKGAISEEVVWNELGNVQDGKYYFGWRNRWRGQRPLYASAQLPEQGWHQTAIGQHSPSDGTWSAGRSRQRRSQHGLSGQPTARLSGSDRTRGRNGAAAPMWAALMACVREALDAKFNGKVPVFFFNDFAYANGNTTAFRDIVGGRQFTFDPSAGMVPGEFIPIGNNRSTQVDGYYAKAGFDLCTGWGSPNGNELLKQLETWLASKPSGK